MKSLHLYIITLVFIYTPAGAQTFHIGDKISGIEFKNIYNYRSGNLKIEDFKGKLIILDFWSFNCLNCIKGFSKMEELQDRFKDKIQVIFVNRENKIETERFFNKRKKFIKVPPLPFITGDSVLNRYFPHNGVPFHVWIDTTGTVSYFTHGYSTTIENVAEFLHGRKLDLAEYNTGSSSEPLFGEKWQSAVQYTSTITGAENGIQQEFLIDTNKYSCLIANGQSVVGLFKIAFNERGKYKFDKPGRTILELIDSFKFVSPVDHRNYDFWKSRYSYNYQLILPKDKEAELYQVMRSDLTRFFTLDAEIVQRPVKSLVLISTGNNHKLASAGGIKKNRFYKNGVIRAVADSIRFFNNYPFSEFTLGFSNFIESNFKLPFFNDVEYNGNIDLSIEGTVVDSGDIDRLRAGLKKNMVSI